MLKKTYTRMKNHQLLLVLLFNLFVLVTAFLVTFHLTRLSGSYHVQASSNVAVQNDTITIHGDEVVGNLSGSDDWSSGSYDLKNDRLTIYLDNQVYHGKITEQSQAFWITIKGERVHFVK